MANTLIPEGYFGEEYAEDVAFLIKPKRILGEVQSKYQKSTIIETETFGRMVFQDGLIYLADRGNEGIYELYIHVTMLTGKPKKKVLLIGAGDGFGIKRFLQYDSIEKLVAIDIDEDFSKLADKVFPDSTDAKRDPRVELLHVDGAEYVANTKEIFDAIIITVGDPFTVSQSMFKAGFFKHCESKLNDEGIVCVDGFMPFYAHEGMLNYWDIFSFVSQSFPITRIATATSPIMPGGLVSFVWGSKKDDPMNKPTRKAPGKTFWYNEKMHQSAFVLPEFMKDKLQYVKGFLQM